MRRTSGRSCRRSDTDSPSALTAPRRWIRDYGAGRCGSIARQGARSVATRRELRAASDRPIGGHLVMRKRSSCSSSHASTSYFRGGFATSHGIGTARRRCGGVLRHRLRPRAQREVSSAGSMLRRERSPAAASSTSHHDIVTVETIEYSAAGGPGTPRRLPRHSPRRLDTFLIHRPAAASRRFERHALESHQLSAEKSRAGCGNRTRDHMITSQVLCQLS